MLKTTTACIALLGVSLTTFAQDERLTLDWIFSDERRLLTAMPRHTWTSGGDLIIYDTRQDKSERTLQTIDPDSGRRRELIDRGDLLESMADILDPDEPMEEPGWPDTFSSDGHHAVYSKSGKLLLVDLRRDDVSVVGSGDESSPRFSPDGEWIAYVRDNDIYAWNIDKADETRLTTDGTDTTLNGTVSWVYWEEFLNRADRGFSWAPDSSAIAYYQTDESGVGEMHYVDFEPNLPRLVKQRHPKPGEANPKVRAGVVTLDNQTTVWVDLGSNPYEYLPRMHWLPDSQQLAVQTMNRAQTVLDIFIASVADGSVSHLLRETNDGWINVHDDIYFLAEREQFIWSSERDGYAHLYLFNMQGELVRQLTSGEWALRGSGGRPGMDQAVSHIDDENGFVYFTALAADSTERHLYRVDLNGDDITQVSAEAGSHAIYFSPSGTGYVDVHSALTVPVSMNVRSPDGVVLTEIVAASNEIANRFDLASWEMFSIDARDGYPMPAMMLKPRLFDPNQQYPVVTYVYGGPSAPTVRNTWFNNGSGLYHQMLSDAGAIVFMVDNRSAAGRSKIDANTIVRQLYGPVELNDLLDGIAWLKSQPYVDPDRVGVWGWSGGGTMTLQSMTSSEEFVAGASVAPVTDWHYYDTIYTERYMKRPQDNAEGYESTSHVKRAADLHGRLLLVHGTYDDNVHPQNSWAFSDALIEAGITFDMMIYPMRKHGISDDAAQKHVFTTMYDFWRRNLQLGD